MNNYQLETRNSTGKAALKKAIALSIPIFIMNYFIVSHIFHDVGFAYFLSHYKVAFYLLFDFVPDFIMFNIVLMIFHKLEHRNALLN